MTSFSKKVVIVFFLSSFCAPIISAEELNHDFVAKRNELVRETFRLLEKEKVTSEIKEMPDPDSWSLTLEECNRLVIDNNTEVRVSYLTLDDARMDVVQKEASFDTNYTFSYDFSRTRTPSTDGLTTASESLPISASLKKKIFSGGTLSAGFADTRSGRKHTHSTDLQVGISQPLLSGLGPDVTYVPLHLARNNYKISIFDLKEELINSLSSAQSAYWDILKTREVLKTRQLAYKQAGDLIEQNKRELTLGNRTKTDVLQSQASAAQREQDVLVAENALAEAEDSLKKILNIRDLSIWNKRIKTNESMELDFKKEKKIELKEALKAAFDNRPDFKKALKNLENDQLTAFAAKDKLLPDLNFEYNLNFNGAGLTWRESVDRLKTGDYPDWEAALTLTYPWGDHSDQAAYQKTVNSVRAREANILKLILQILKEVRSAVRDVNVNLKRVEVANLAYELQQEKLEAEQKKYSLGISTSFEVLTFQEDLANSGVTRIQTIVDYHKSLITLWQVLGISLEKNNIQFKENGKDNSRIWFS